MSIAETKTRMSLVIGKADKAKLENIAKKNDRSVNYIINQAIKQYIETASKTDKEGGIK